MTNVLLEAALDYAAHYLNVFPIRERAKTPLTRNGFLSASADEGQIAAWFQARPEANLAIRTGSVSGVFVLDIDARHGGDETLRDLEARYGPLPDTWRALTGGGGVHLYFRHPGYAVPCSAGKVGAGIDVRGDGGYVVAPPSTHESGRDYVWEFGFGPDDVPLADAPPWLLSLIGAGERANGKTAAPPLDERITEGRRNAALLSLGGTMRRRGMSEGAILAALSVENEARCDPPLDEGEVAKIARSVGRYKPDGGILDSRPDPMNRESRIEKPAGFRLTRLSDLLAEPDEVTPSLVDGLLPYGGVSLLAARPKVGKTTLARYLARCVARGEPFLGRATVQGPVLLFLLEEKRAAIRRLFERLGLSDEPIHVHIGAAPKDALAAFEAALEEHRPALAVVDPIAKLVRVRDMNDYAEMSRSLEPLIELARKYDSHLMLSHHLGKADRADGDDVLGSTAIFGAVDTLILMKRRDEGRVIRTIQRYGDDLPETVVGLDAETGELSVLGEVAGIQLRQACEAVLAAVPDGKAWTEADIRERVGGNNTLTGKAIRQLVDDGRLVRAGAGKKNAPYRYSHAVKMLDSRLTPLKRESRIEHSGACTCGEPLDESGYCLECDMPPAAGGDA
jgi:hypothetical protein